MSGMTLSHDAALEAWMVRRYGEVAKEIVSQRTTTTVRYGGEKNLATSALQLQGLIHKYPATIYANREQAITVLKEGRKQRKAGGAP